MLCALIVLSLRAQFLYGLFDASHDTAIGYGTESLKPTFVPSDAPTYPSCYNCKRMSGIRALAEYYSDGPRF